MSKKTASVPYNSDSEDDDVPVVVFNERSYGIMKNKKPSAEAGRPDAIKGKIDLDTSNVVSSSQRATMDAEDIADLEVSELWDRLKNSVEDLAASSLSGKDHKKYLVEKAARLSGVEIPKPKAPFRILKGMREKAQVREKKAKEEARVTDSVKIRKVARIAVSTKAANRAQRITKKKK